MSVYFNLAYECLENNEYFRQQNTSAFTIINSNLNSETLSYVELKNQSEVVAQKILDLGSSIQGNFPPRILILLENQIEFATSFFGVIMAGHVAVCISTLSSNKELEFYLKDCSPQIVISSEELFKAFEKVFENCYNGLFLSCVFPEVNKNNAVKNLTRGDLPYQKPHTEKNSPAYITYTSGTTSFPKGVVHAQRSILGRQPASNYWFNFNNNEKVFHSGKLNWTYTLGTGFMDVLYRGHSVHLFHGKLTVELWQQVINKFSITIFISVPAFYRQILKYTIEGRKFSSLRQCMSAGEQLPSRILEDFADKFGQKIYEGLGMSEISYYISNHPSFAIKAGSAGKIQSGHQVEVINEEGKRCKADEVGMIHIGQEDLGLALGYWQKKKIEPLCDKRMMLSTWFATGDFVYYDEENYIWFQGRKDDIISSFGYRISPLEIERVTRELPQINNCAAIGEELEEAKIIIVLFIEADEKLVLSEIEIIEYLSQHLAPYKVPKKIYLIEKLPYSKNGKVLRKKLAALIKP